MPSSVVFFLVTALTVGCATVPPVLDDPGYSWEAGCNDDGRSWQDALVYTLREEWVVRTSASFGANEVAAIRADRARPFR